MELRINDELVPYTLEEEHSLLDVVKSVSDWLSGSGYTLVSAETESGPISLDDTEPAANREIQSVRFLHINAEPAIDLYIEQLSTVYQLFGLINQAVLKEKRDSFTDLIREYASIRGSIADLLGNDGTWDGGSVFENLVNRYQTPSAEASAAVELLSFLSRFQTLLAERIREASNPIQEITKTVKLCSTMLPGISELSLLLQTGKDREAMDKFILFTEAVGKLYRTIPFVQRRFPNLFPSEGDIFAASIQDLNRFFSELIEAFTIHDTVLIGDLLEYEIGPRVSSFLTLVSSALAAGQPQKTEENGKSEGAVQ